MKTIIKITSILILFISISPILGQNHYKCGNEHINLNAKDKIRLKVYPNPATDFLKIEIDGVIEDNPSVFIYNAFGKEIIRLNDIKKETYTLQINNLSKGIYFYKLKSKKVQNIYGKFIIN